MTDKEMVGVRLPKDTLRRVEDYAEEHEVSQSDAIRRLLREGADLQETGLTVAGRSQQDKKEEEKELVADGGQNVRPMLRFLGSLYAFLSLSIFGIIFLAGTGIATFSFVAYTTLIAVMMASLLLVALTMLILNTSYPEKADRLVNMTVRRVSRLSPIRGGSKA